MTLLLWADDDAMEILDPIERRLRRAEFHVDRARNYEEALKLLEENTYKSVLLDVILSYSSGKGALPHDAGVGLAESAALSGTTLVAFLTVTRKAIFWSKIEELEEQFPAVTFQYFDKLDLLAPGAFKELTDFLATNGLGS